MRGGQKMKPCSAIGTLWGISILVFAGVLFAESGNVESGDPETTMWKNAGYEVPLVVKRAPDVHLRGMDGSDVNASLQDRIVILHFWATFCAPCRAEMHELDQLQKHFKRENLLIVAISIDSHDGAVKNFMEREKLRDILIVRDPSTALRDSYAIDAIPMSYVIVDGRIRARIRGTGNWAPKFWKAMLDRFLNIS